MSVFTNPNESIQGNVFGNYIRKEGYYKNCKAVRIEELPNNPAVALRIDWQVPGQHTPISDFIPRDNGDTNKQYIVNHALELALATSTKDVPMQITLAQAESIYNSAVKAGVTVDIDLRAALTKSGKTRYNVSYSKPENTTTVASEEEEQLALF